MSVSASTAATPLIQPEIWVPGFFSLLLVTVQLHLNSMTNGFGFLLWLLSSEQFWGALLTNCALVGGIQFRDLRKQQSQIQSSSNPNAPTLLVQPKPIIADNNYKTCTNVFIGVIQLATKIFCHETGAQRKKKEQFFVYSLRLQLQFASLEIKLIAASSFLAIPATFALTAEL